MRMYMFIYIFVSYFLISRRICLCCVCSVDCGPPQLSTRLRDQLMQRQNRRRPMSATTFISCSSPFSSSSSSSSSSVYTDAHAKLVNKTYAAIERTKAHVDNKLSDSVNMYVCQCTHFCYQLCQAICVDVCV